MPRQRFRYIRETRQFAEIPEDKPFYEGHFVQDDTISPLMNHADGKYYDSKSAFRKATRRAGCAEIGNDAFSHLNRRDIPDIGGEERDLSNAYDALEATGGNVREALDRLRAR